MKNLPLTQTNYKTLHEAFSELVRAKGYAATSQLMYPTCIREFLFFLENKNILDEKEIKAVDIMAYHDYIRTRPNQRRGGLLSESMIRHHLFALRIFFDFLMESGRVKSSPAHLPKFVIGTSKERQVLTEEEVKELYEACEDKRGRAILSVAYGCGLRRSEIAALEVNDIAFHKGMLTVRKGKNGKSREVPMSKRVQSDLRDFLINQRDELLKMNFYYKQTPLTAFFITNQGIRMSGEYIARLLKKVIERTNNPTIIQKEITLHSLRHSIATHLLDRGAAIEFVQEFLGHSEMDTSMLYAKRRKRKLMIQNNMR